MKGGMGREERTTGKPVKSCVKYMRNHTPRMADFSEDEGPLASIEEFF